MSTVAVVRHAMATIERLGYESGLSDSYLRTDSEIISKHPLMTTGQPASGGPSLSSVDAIFCMTHRDAPLTDQQKAAESCRMLRHLWNGKSESEIPRNELGLLNRCDSLGL